MLEIGQEDLCCLIYTINLKKKKLDKQLEFN